MLGIITGGLTAFGLVVGGVWTMELHYATKPELAQHVQAHAEERAQLRTDVLETRRALLETQLYELRITAERRSLTELERQRYEQLRLELGRLAEQIRELGTRAR